MFLLACVRQLSITETLVLVSAAIHLPENNHFLSASYRGCMALTLDGEEPGTTSGGKNDPLLLTNPSVVLNSSGFAFAVIRFLFCFSLLFYCSYSSSIFCIGALYKLVRLID